MSQSKHFEKIAWTVTAVMLILTVLFMNGAALGIGIKEHTMGYETRLFDNKRVHTIDIVMNNWDEFIANATSEEYYAANVVIDGEAYKNVGIRGKGNTSLSTVSSLGSQRYSFKIEFDQYDSSITYHGLDKLSLNNLIQDSTMMKDYLTYTMMDAFGVNAPLCSFVYITVNGEEWGLYLAVEGVEDAFLERNYGSDYGELYKPDSMSFGGGRGNGMDFNMEDFMSGNMPSSDETATGSRGGFDRSAMQNGEMPEEFDPSSLFGDMGGGRGGMGGFGGGMGSDDVKLQYIDDRIDSYSNIWNNAKTDVTEADQMRLIESLRKLSAGEEIASVVDVEQVIRYFVVHNFVCNGDSYTGNMIHNYYLYEENGQLAMIPWDYNLAFGTFSGGEAGNTVNTPIDSPVSGGSSDRPMLHWIFESEEYTALYHQYFAEFLRTVDAAGIIDGAYDRIKSYVEKDPTAFYSYEEFEAGVSTLRLFCELRSESITMQLENGETVNTMNYVDASGITLSDMGSMNMGGERGGFDGEMPEDFDPSQFTGGRGGNTPDGNGFQQMPGQSGSTPTGKPTGTEVGGGAGNIPEMPGNMPAGDMPADMPEGFDSSILPGGAEGEIPSQSVGAPPEIDAIPPADSDATPGTDNGNTFVERPSRDNMQMPGGDFSFNMTGAGTSTASGWLWIGFSAFILAAGLLIAKLYKY